MQRHVARSAIVRYGLAVLCVAVAVILALWLRPVTLVGGQLSLVAILITGWVCGLRPALVALGLATLAFVYYFTPPLDSFGVDLHELPRVIVFALLGLFMATVSAARRKAQDLLESARAQLEARVRERTTELERSNERLRESEEQWRAVFENNPTMYFMVDATSTVVSVNPGGAEELGYTVDELVGQSVLKVFHEPDRPAVQAQIAFCLQQLGRTFRWDLRKVRKDGTVLWVRETAKAMRRSGGETIVLVASKDITEHKEAEEERQERRWTIESMDRVNRAIQGTNDLEQMMSDVLDAALSIFECDRAWLVYPCDPEASSVRHTMHRARPEFPGRFGVGEDLPRHSDSVTEHRIVRAASGPVRFDPESEHPLSTDEAKCWGIQSRIAMALYPKGDLPYMFGLSQCSHPRVWSRREEVLFQAIGRRLADALTSLTMFRRLRESERRLEEAQRISHVGYWERDAVTNRSTWSDETWRILGLSPEPRSMSLGEVLERIHPAVRERREKEIAEALRGGLRYDSEYRVVRPSGEVRFVRSQGDVLRDESGQPRRLFGTIQDITERKLTEQRLLAQHAVTQVLAAATTLEEATPKILKAVCECLVWDVGALWRVDREAGVLRCVEIWHTAAIDVPEFAATSRSATFPQGIGLPGRVWAARESVYLPDVVRDSNFLRAPVAAREGLHAAFGVPILLGHEVLGVMEFLSNDIRQPDEDLLDMMGVIGSQIGQFIERKRAEEALVHARAELAYVTRVTTLGELAASIAHEVNQPLAAIVADATASLNWLAAANPNLDIVRETLDAIVKDGHRAADVIQRIRQLAARSAPPKVRLDLNDVVRDVIPLLRAELHRHEVALVLDLAADLPLVLGDRVQLQQVVLNLVMNAIEAMAAVTDRPRELRIGSTRHDADHVTVTVQDTGVGIDWSMRDQLFTAFFTTKLGGMGMGLSISRSIIEAHGGRLWTTPNRPHGALFHFALPVAEGPVPDEGRVDSPPPGSIPSLPKSLKTIATGESDD